MGPAAYTALLAPHRGAVGRGGLPALWDSLKADRRGVLLALLIPMVLGATSFFLAPTGLAAAADLLGSRLLGRRPGGHIRDMGNPVSPAAERAAARGFRHCWVDLGVAAPRPLRDRVGMAAGVALLVPLLGRGRHPMDLALVVLALALLAGPAIGARCAPSGLA